MRHAGPISSSRFAFTLIEILIVIAIIALLAALLFPAFNRARESGRQTTCATNLQQISIAVQQYFQDERRYPDSLVDLLPEGAKYDDGTTSPTPVPTIAPNVTGYLKNGSDGLLCPNDDLDNSIPRSSYGSLSKTVPARPTDFATNPNADVGRYAYNYWGYDADGFAYPDASTAATNTSTGSLLLVVPKDGAGTDLQFYHSSMGPPTAAQKQRPQRNVLRYSLANRFAPPSTIVLHCMFHRVQTADNLIAPGQLGDASAGSGSKNARDIVLRLDGSAKSVNVSEWNPTPGATPLNPAANKWQTQTPSP